MAFFTWNKKEVFPIPKDSLSNIVKALEFSTKYLLSNVERILSNSVLRKFFLS